MGNPNRVGDLAVLQNAAAAAGNGTALNVDDCVGALFEISGTFTGLTANFEGSVDGATYHAVQVENLADGAKAAAQTAVGLYRLERVPGLQSVRARITAATPTGSITVKARRALV